MKIYGGIPKKMIMTKKRNSRQAGFNLIELMIVIAIIGLLISVGTVGWKAMVESGNETSAIQTVRLIQTSQRAYSLKKSGNFGTFEELVSTVDMDKQFSVPEPVVNGYKFTMKVTPKSTTSPARYEVSAEPQQKGGLQSTGSKCYYSDSSLSTIKFSDTNCPATANDQSLGQ